MTNQTLAEWASQAQITAEVHRSGARFIYRPCNLPSNWPQLWHLADYAVSSQTGGVVWLVQRSPSDSKSNKKESPNAHN